MRGACLVAVVACSCVVKGEVDHGLCDDYIACGVAVGASASDLNEGFGDESPCWDSEDAASNCRDQCEQGLALQAVAHPEEEACDGEGLPRATSYTFGGWPIDVACDEAITPTGDEEGDVLEGTSLLDQWGQQVDLHDFCAHAVLIASTPLWATFDPDALQEVADRYPDDLVVVLAATEDEDAEPATEETVTSYATLNDLGVPVLADGDGELFSRLEVDNAVPSYHLVGPGVVLSAKDTSPFPTDAEIEAVLP